MENLNIHHKKPLTDLYGAEFGAEIWDRFTVHSTPTHGSWLNQEEIEIGIFSRQCLGTRRIPDLETLRREARAWNLRMNRDRIKITGNLTANPPGASATTYDSAASRGLPSGVNYELHGAAPYHVILGVSRKGSLRQRGLLACHQRRQISIAPFRCFFWRCKFAECRKRRHISFVGNFVQGLENCWVVYSAWLPRTNQIYGHVPTRPSCHTRLSIRIQPVILHEDIHDPRFELPDRLGSVILPSNHPITSLKNEAEIR